MRMLYAAKGITPIHRWALGTVYYILLAPVRLPVGMGQQAEQRLLTTEQGGGEGNGHDIGGCHAERLSGPRRAGSHRTGDRWW